MSTNVIDDVADSTDWLSTPVPGLSAVEAALRCQICKDFYKTPMLTSCNHTFCSVCIRRVLSSDGKCPLCRHSEQEIKLRSNWSMEEVVEAFTRTRNEVLKFAQAPPTLAPAPRSESPKRKIDEVDLEEDGVSGSGRASNKRLRSSSRLSKSRGAEATAEMARQEAFVSDPGSQAIDEPDDGLVACPICSQRMKEPLVFQHIDTSCPGEAGAQASRSTSQQKNSPAHGFPIASANSFQPSKTYERLASVNYSMLKDAQLRKKMQDLGISTSGPRQTLERRHKEWMTIWNANCDSLHPRKKSELLQDLDVWERTLGTRAPTASKSIHLGAQIKDKDFDGAAWAAQHDTSFKDLIASARRNRGSQAQTTGEKKKIDTAEASKQSANSEAASMPTGSIPTPQPPPIHEQHWSQPLPLGIHPGIPPVTPSSSAQLPQMKPVEAQSETEVLQPLPWHPTVNNLPAVLEMDRQQATPMPPQSTRHHRPWE